MSEAAPHHIGKIIAIALVIVIISAALGTYLVFHYQPQGGNTTGHGFAVNSNKVVFVKLPNFNYSAGIWQMQLSNAGNTTAYAQYSIRVNGNIADGNSSTLLPGQLRNVTTCFLASFSKLTTFEVSIFLSNSSGTSSANYPVTIQNATQSQYSGQFSVTNELNASVYYSEFQKDVSRWSITISNLGTRPIEFAYAELWNSSALLSVFQVLCAGQSYLNNYGQPLAPGQSASDARPLSSAYPTVIAGKTYRVDVVAVYSDFSEVAQTYEIQATS